MNTEALFLFLILLLGLVLCSFLGGNCGKEGLVNNSSDNTVFNGPNGATATLTTSSNAPPKITLTQTSGSENVIFTQSSSNSNLFTNPFGPTATISNGNIIISTPNKASQLFTPTQPSSSNSTPYSLSSFFDNYNHYSGSGSSSQLQNGMIFTDTSGNTITVIINSNGTRKQRGGK